MATVTQIYTIINSIAKQVLGSDAVTVTDATWVSFGKEILKSDENVDSFYNVLADRIGRTVIAVRAYRAQDDDIHREPMEWGAAMQKISFELPNAVSNDSWKSQSVRASDPFAKSEMSVKQSIFAKVVAWEFDITIKDNTQLKTAFVSPTAMAAFIDGIFTATYNSLELSYENVVNLIRATTIAKKSTMIDGRGYINLLSEYNTETNKGLTLAAALYDVDFLKYCAMQLSLYSDRLTRMSVLFNDGSVARHTPKDLQVVRVNSEFARRMAYYLEADTYHDDIVSLKRYKAVPYWQGGGTDLSFDTTTSIKVNIDGEDDPIELNHVVAIIHDIDAMGVTINNRRTRSIYNPKEEYTNYFNKAEIGAYSDPSENCIVFYLAED